MPVSVRTRFDTRSAAVNSVFNSGPVAPHFWALSNASFTCPAI